MSHTELGHFILPSRKEQFSCLYLTHVVQHNRCAKTELLPSAIQQRLTGVVQKQTRSF